MAPVAIATGLGWVLGGPLGAAILGGTSHLVNQSGVNQSRENRSRRRDKVTETEPDSSANNLDYEQQADIYLARFSEEALRALASYERETRKVLDTEITLPKAELSDSHAAQLHLIKTTKEDLSELLGQA